MFPSRILKLHTTRSWDFTGLPTNKVGGPEEGDVIIGLLDTGKYMKIILGALLIVLFYKFINSCYFGIQESGQNLRVSMTKI